MHEEDGVHVAEEPLGGVGAVDEADEVVEAD